MNSQEVAGQLNQRLLDLVDRDASSPSRGFNRLITELLGSDLVARRKFGVTTSNGLVFHNLYLDPAPDARVEEFLDDMRLISILPKSNLERPRNQSRGWPKSE